MWRNIGIGIIIVCGAILGVWAVFHFVLHIKG